MLEVVPPYLAEAAAMGVTALVECSTVGVGRNLSVLRGLAEETSIHILAPTGVYRDAYFPESVREMSEGKLAELWIKELTEGIEGTSIRAGFIKLAMSDDDPTALEIRNLKAAARASQATGVGIASHTIGGGVAKQEMDVLEQAGLDLGRFIWVHARTEPDISILKEAARRGAYLELDAVRAPYHSQQEFVEMAAALIESGLIDQLLLSHDAGWYDPASANGLPGNGYRGYTTLVRDFILELLKRDIQAGKIEQITVRDPARVFAF